MHHKAVHVNLNMTANPDFFQSNKKTHSTPKKPNPPPRINTQGDLRQTMHNVVCLKKKKKKKKNQHMNKTQHDKT